MKKFYTLILLAFLAFNSYAQNFNFGALYDDFNFDRNTIDSTANAVVLKEYGTTSFYVDDLQGRLVLIHEYHVKIKIFNKDGFKHANVIIPTYKDGNTEELIQELKGSTFNLVDGRSVETVMDKKAVFTENRSKYTQLTKFTLPNIKDGSIIEYSYTLQSPLLFNFKTWTFQSDIPKVSSTYVANIPGNYNYNVVLRGYYKLSDQKSELYRECIRINGTPMDCSKMTYVMNNVPAFIEEDYMTAASNFKSAIYFELSDVTQLNGSKQKYTLSWNDIDNQLVTEKSFGGQMKRKDAFKEIIPSIIKDAKDDLTKAQDIYNYIKKQIKWNNYYGKYSEENIKTVLANRSGNVADINFSLIAALSAANLDAEAVILSTRDNGLVNKIYPVMSNFDYVIAKVNINGTSYLLDATDPLLPFGLLPLRCINDQGRVINLKKPSYWIDLKASVKNATNYTLNGKLTKEGKIEGTLVIISNGYSALNKRKDIKKSNSIEEYVEKLDESLTKISINNHEILALDSAERPLVEKYDIVFSAFQDSGKSNFQLNPFFINRISKNPFNLMERTYPVDLGASSDERIVISLTLPEKLDMAEKPKDMAIALPSGGGRYILQTTFEDQKLNVSQVLQLNKAIYSPDEYLYLKEFYSKIIQNQKTDVLLKAAK